MGQNENRQSLIEKLKFDDNLEGYGCEYSLGDTPIEVLLTVEEGCESDAIQVLADNAEAIFREWPTLQETILKAARKTLVDQGRLKRGDESKVTFASLVPFLFSATYAPDTEPFFSFGITIPGVLSEHEHFDYGNNFDMTSENTEIVHLM